MLAAVDEVKVSKRLSYVLRHRPDSIGLDLADGGWIAIDDLLAALARHGTQISREDLESVVAGNDKRRFTIEGGRIRANQGHSIEVDLALEPVTPPDTLFHGTATRFLDSILRQGLVRGARHHVHLSADGETARQVGSRHGKPVVLTVASGRMATAGHGFFLSANGVWLTEHVPPAYLVAT
jgi:putative RNA 2'-phosphotransferase